MQPDSPQVENGFVRIANELYDAILAAPFSKRELLIVLAIIRKTYGFGKKSDDITMTQLASLTGLSRPHVGETVAELGKKNVFLIRDGVHGKVIGLSKNYKNWNFKQRTDSVQSRIGTCPETGTRPSRNGNNGVPKREIDVPETGHTIDNPKRQLQKTIPKDSYQPGVSTPTWTAYSGAYFQRYGVDPVRNAMVSGQLASLVKRIGADDAPLVAAFFVSHNNAYYVRQGHSVGALLRDAEKLRTEWATNSRMTETKARQVDQTQAQGDVWKPLIEEAEANAARIASQS